MIGDCTAKQEKGLQTEINIDVLDAILLGFISSVSAYWFALSFYFKADKLILM